MEYGRVVMKRITSACVVFLSLFLISRPLHAGEIRVLTSFLPIYVFTKNVVGERAGVRVECLLPANAGPHDYQMRPSDMKKVFEADFVIMNGIGLEAFMEDALSGHRIKKKLFESAKGLPLMKIDGDGADHAGHDYGKSYNPHAWVSPKMASLQVDAIADILSEADPEGEGIYRENSRQYKKRLHAIQEEMEAFVKGVANKKIVTYHNAFDYLARDIGLEVAGVVFRSEGVEPTSGDLSKLIRIIRDNDIRAIFTEPQFSPRMAQLIAGETGVAIFSLDPLATGKFELDYYEKIQLKNLDSLKKALK